MPDYIVVGAGSAGCVLAGRLSDDPDTSVLLLEAGPRDTDPRIRIPAAFPRLFKSRLDWDLETVPQKHAGGRRLYWPRGKVVGGCSSTNAMIYMRGNRRDYEDWAAHGCPGWSFAECLPSFVETERNTRLSGELHGTAGPLTVSDGATHNPTSEAFVRACEQAGYGLNQDFNGMEQDGAGFFQVTMKAGRRCSAADAFLRPALGRDNLEVETGARVTQILIEGTRARGVSYVQHGIRQTAYADREVIVCLGAVHSPQLLMLSGVGPADHLRDLGIECRIDLPGVGENLHDHPSAPVIALCKRRITLDTAETPWNFLKYALFKSGPLTSNIAEAGAFVRSRDGLDRPDLQFHFAPAFFDQHGLSGEKRIACSCGVVLVQPKSRGTLRLRSNDPGDAPLIDPDYLSNEEDVEALIAGTRIARQILRQPAFAEFLGEEFLPGAQIQSDDELRGHVREHLETLYHPAGTCRMGLGATAVVDTHLRVHGIEGLRVADASVMPKIVGGNTNAPTIMIGERAADFILSGDSEPLREAAPMHAQAG